MQLTQEHNQDFEILKPQDYLSLGQWVWVSDWGDDLRVPGIGPDGFTFVCIVAIGSNYVEVNSPREPGNFGSTYERIHFDDLNNRITIENDPKKIIKRINNYFGERSEYYLDQIKAITAKLGIQSDQFHLTQQEESGSKGIAVISGQNCLETYKSELIKAKEVDLPDLFESLKKSNKKLAMWMSADSMGFQIQSDQLKQSMAQIDYRIFNVSLYAGLTEHVVKCRDGDPAEYNEKLRVMQRKLFMDEESLVNYKHGGMEFYQIEEFDDWLSEVENFHRILPYERCIVAMQVRRKTKDRVANSIGQAFINFKLEKADKLTFLYIRNGGNLYRLNCDLEFGEKLIPDKALFTPDEQLVFKMHCSRINEFMTLSEYEDRNKEVEKKRKLSDDWETKNPDADWFDNPYTRHYGFCASEWHRFDSSSVYYDDALKHKKEELIHYNRIALIIQGLFDRSNVLHPHPPVQSWTKKGFYQAIEPIYDASTCLYDGDMPDFESYRLRCNNEINASSVMIGQQAFWVKKETEKERERRLNDWRSKDDYLPEVYIPYGNPGPGDLAKMSSWKPRARKAVFSWNRERAYSSIMRDIDPWIRTTVTVPEKDLLNASAYKPGDYKQFFKDPRTRQEYLKWAFMLLTAEEFHAGNLIPNEPVEATGSLGR